MADLHIKVGGAWKAIDDASVKVSGAWKQVDNIYVKVSGTWKSVWSYFSLSPTTSNVSDLSTLGDSFAGIKFFSDGTHYRTDPEADGSNTYSVSLGNWLDAGAASGVWIVWTRSGGTLGDWNSEDSGDARLNFDGSDYGWRITRPTVSGSGSSTIIGTFDFYDAATGGNLLATTGELTFTCQIP